MSSSPYCVANMAFSYDRFHESLWLPCSKYTSGMEHIGGGPTADRLTHDAWSNGKTLMAVQADQKSKYMLTSYLVRSALAWRDHLRGSSAASLACGWHASFAGPPTSS